MKMRVPEKLSRNSRVDILGFDIYQANILRDNTAFMHFFSKDLTLLESVASSHHKIPVLTEFGYNEIPDSSWWTKVFFPTVESHQVVYALA